MQLAKASTFALVSMLVIVVAVIFEGSRASSDLRGDISGSLFVNTGFIQAVGVISFGRSRKYALYLFHLLT